MVQDLEEPCHVILVHCLTVFLDDFSHYMLQFGTLERLVISRCNLKDVLQADQQMVYSELFLVAALSLPFIDLLQMKQKVLSYLSLLDLSVFDPG